MTDAADDLASAGDNFITRLLFQIVPESIVGRNKEPRLPTCRKNSTRKCMAVGPGVIRPVHEIWRAFRTCEKCCASARSDCDLILFLRDITHSERDGRVWQVNDHV